MEKIITEPLNQADECDQAFIAGQLFTDLLIRKASIDAAAISTLNDSGICWWCEEKTGKERRFCNKDCAHDWEKNERRG